MNRRQFARICGPVLTAAIFSALVAITAAQDSTVRLDGKVAWISANQMVVAPLGGPAVTVDLSQVDLDQYATLMSGDWVIVDGASSPDGKRLVATSVQRVER